MANELWSKMVEVLEDRKRSTRLLKVRVAPPREGTAYWAITLDIRHDGKDLLFTGVGMDKDAAREQAARIALSKIG
jgi:hypothetical protein